MTAPNTSPSLSRRAVLAGAAASTVPTAGCAGRLQGVVGAQPSQLSLEIKTLPTDIDPYGIEIARHLQENLEAVGIGVRVEVMGVEPLTREVFLNHDFDIYVGQFPYSRSTDPDVFYPMFRSTFTSEAGWQNPFGFTNLSCDDALDSQRTSSGSQRASAVVDFQEQLARTQPITPIVFPDSVTGVRTDRFTGWDPDDRDPALGGPTAPHNLLQLEGVDDQPQPLRLAVVDDRIITNRNPISAAYQQDSSLLDLVYDSVALDGGTEQIPWLASEFTWLDSEGPPAVEIRLRDGLRWHDGQQLSAYDVGFTYAFLQDTSLGAASRPIPAERFRGQTSLIEDVRVENAHELTLTFSETSQTVAQRALTVPILPAHIWRGRTRIERRGDRAGRTTAALTTNNAAAVGSGPFRFVQRDGDLVEFARFQPHFLWRDETDPETANGTTTEPSRTENDSDLLEFESDPLESEETDDSTPPLNETTTDGFVSPPESYSGLPAFDTITVQNVSSAVAAVELLTAGDADATATMLNPGAVTTIDESPETEHIESRSNAFYHLGFNTRRRPLRNPNMRRLIAQLVDKSTLVEQQFDGRGVPAATPLSGSEWLPTDHRLRWDDTTSTDPEVPFLGSDGELSVERARARFRDIGYQYTTDNELITQI